MNKTTALVSFDNSAIAIIGMSGSFPGAKNIDEFWRNLRDGVESISFFSTQELEASGVNPVTLNDPNYIKAGALLENIDLFDASFFGINPKDAELMSPQHRLFLECAWEALEHAGHDPEKYEGSIGVYSGLGVNTYWPGINLLSSLYTQTSCMESVDPFQILVGNENDYLSSFVSYKLNLKGPSITLQTACSTSLVAVHLACQGLLNGEFDMALAGGVSLRIPHKAGYFYQEGGVVSPDGHTRTFDSKAQGTVFSSGVGIIVLKRLVDAINDNNFIHAIIRGSAVNNDGSLKAGYTAPSLDSQADVITEAQAVAGVEAETISYIEAHGTGTYLGDPIEFAALTQAFSRYTKAKGFCAIGSVKTNIGHLEAAAGIAGLIKTILSLKHKQLPASLHFEQPNPNINFTDSPFYVNTTLSEWKADKAPRRAGVSAFGIGGTNAHVIVEEAPTIEATQSCRPWHLLLLSAKTDSALETATTNLVEYLVQQPNCNLADVANTLQVGRRAFPYRRMLVCNSVDDAVTALETHNLQRVITGFHESEKRSVIFTFPGQGSQYVNMALELYQVEPIFRQEVDRSSEILKPHLGVDLRSILYPNEEQKADAAQQLQQTQITQPALFVIEYALAKLWMAWGVRPTAMVGHSIGEYVAACLSGVFSVEEALALVATRGRLIQGLPGGAMLAVSLSEEKIQPFLRPSLSIAALNSPSLCVISGSTNAIDALQSQLDEKEIGFRRLHTSHAFHSEMMEPILEEFTKCVKKVSLQHPKTPYISNVTGTWITASQATDPSYWAMHLRQTVRFTEGIQELLIEPNQVMLEVGPGRTLSTLVKQHPYKSAEQLVLSSLRHPQEICSDVAFLLNALGKLWLAGISINWDEFSADTQCCRLPLPTYPFERQRYWVESQTAKQLTDTNTKQALLRKQPNITDWFYVPSWKRLPLPKLSRQENLHTQQSCWLVFINDCEFVEKIVRHLVNDGKNVITVKVGQSFAKLSKQVYTIDLQKEDDYSILLEELCKLGQSPTHILHTWSLTSNNQAQLGVEFFEQCQNLGFYSLLFLVQALEKQNATHSVQLWTLSNHVQAVTGREQLYPEKATLLSLLKVLPQELSHIIYHSIDVEIPELGTWQEEKLIAQLIAEFRTNSSDFVVSYRENHRWIQTFEAIPLDVTAGQKTQLRQGGVYLFTGGLESIVSLFVDYLVQTVQAKLVIVEPLSFPERDQWLFWLATYGEQDRISRKIRKIQTIEEQGIELLVIKADATNEEQMEGAIAQVYEKFGHIHGVIHTYSSSEDRLVAAISEINQAECAMNFKCKVLSLFVLETILQGKKLDFCLVQSSLSSILGGLGLVAETAAYLFVDAFIHKHNQSNPVSWLSLNWDSLQLEDLADKTTTLSTALTEFAINPKECIEVFQRVLCTDSIEQLIISTGNLQSRINQWLTKNFLEQSEKLKPVNPSFFHPRPQLTTAYVAATTKIQQIIADVWKELLGIEELGIQDNFFNLGGHSLMATQMISRLKHIFPIELPLRRLLLEASTIEKLAEVIEELLIQKIEELSEEEVQSLL